MFEKLNVKLLQGIKIINFTRLLPGPLATHLLAQMGAEIVKIESPERMDYARFIGPQIDDASYLFHQLNHNKESIIVDYNTEEGIRQVTDLVSSADAVIEQFRPGAMDAWGLGYDALIEVNPSLVYLSITGYSSVGKYSSEAGHDLNYLAYSGIMSLLKDDQGKPIVAGTQFADIAGAYMAVMALQSALIQKLKTGMGSKLNVPLANAMNPFLALPHSLESGGLKHEATNIINGKVAVNYAVYQCADNKWLSLAALEMKFWNNFCDSVNRPEWKTENQFDLIHAAFDKTNIEELFLSKTRDQWIKHFEGQDVCVAPILEMDELEDSDFHKDGKTFEKIKTPTGHKLSTVALPFTYESEFESKA